MCRSRITFAPPLSLTRMRMQKIITSTTEGRLLKCLLCDHACINQSLGIPKTKGKSKKISRISLKIIYNAVLISIMTKCAKWLVYATVFD